MTQDVSKEEQAGAKGEKEEEGDWEETGRQHWKEKVELQPDPPEVPE